MCLPTTQVLAQTTTTATIITAELEEITQGGTYVLDGSFTSEHVVTISTTEEVVLTTNGASVEADVAFVYTVAGANLTLSDFNYYREASIYGESCFSFQGEDNTLTVEGENSVVMAGSKSGANRTTSPLIEVPNTASLTFVGSGSINLEGEGSDLWAPIVGATQGTLAGSISFGAPGSSTGPTVRIVTASSVLSCALGSLATGSTSVAGTPGTISFNSGRVDLDGVSHLIASPCDPADGLTVKIAAAATVNFVVGDTWYIGSSPYMGPILSGFHNGVRVEQGTFIVESGAVVRCYAAYGTDDAFSAGYDADIVFMNTVSSDGDAITGMMLDASEALDGVEGTVDVYVDDELLFTYDPQTQGGSSNMDASSSSIIPLWLTKKDHVITVGDETYDLIWDGTGFSTEDPTFTISYDYNIGDDFLYQTPSSTPEKTEFKGSESAFELEEIVLEGYNFLGWYLCETDSDGNVVIGEKVESIDPSSMSDRKNFELIAQWEPIMLDLTYDYWEGGIATIQVQYGKAVIVDGQTVNAELTSADIEGGFTVARPSNAEPDKGYTTIGYQAAIDEDGNVRFTLMSGMPDTCTVTIVQPDEDCEIWAVDPTTNERYELSAEGTFAVINGTTIELRAYPEDGYEFDYFIVDGEPLVDEDGKAIYAVTVYEHTVITASARMVTFIRASIPADEDAELINGDLNEGWRKSADGIQYRIIKTGIRYVNGVAQYVTDYPVYDGDPLYEGDVITCIGLIDDSIVPDDPDMEYVGEVRFSFNGSDFEESEATYRVTGEEEGSAEASDLEAEAGVLEIVSELPEYTQKTWLNIADTSWYNADEAVQYISSAEQLAGIIALMGEGEHFANMTIVLTNDISLVNNDGTEGKRLWVMRKSSSLMDYTFMGTLDGNGYTISGMQIELDNSIKTYAGLFAYIEGGTVKNLTVEGSISPADGVSVSGAWYLGGIVGYLDGGTIENCTSRVTIRGYSYLGGIAGGATESTIAECVNKGAVQGTLQNIGGIVGRLDVGGNFLIEDCINTGSISCTGTSSSAGGSAGGIVGYTYGNTSVSYSIEFINCINTGSVSSTRVAGGIIAEVDQGATFINCMNTGDISVTTTASNPGSAGGLVGYAISTTMSGCVNTGDISVEIDSTTKTYGRAGGLVGYLFGTRSGALIESSYSTGTVDIGYAEDGSSSSCSPTTLSGAGGLVGVAYWVPTGSIELSNSYAAGDVNWSLKSESQDACSICGASFTPGGLIGTAAANEGSGSVILDEKSSSAAGLYISSCVYLDDLGSGLDLIGRQPLIGSGALADEDNYAGMTKDELITEVLSWVDDAGESLFILSDELPNDGLPVLVSQSFVDMGGSDSGSDGSSGSGSGSGSDSGSGSSGSGSDGGSGSGSGSGSDSDSDNSSGSGTATTGNYGTYTGAATGDGGNSGVNTTAASSSDPDDSDSAEGDQEDSNTGDASSVAEQSNSDIETSATKEEEDGAAETQSSGLTVSMPVLTGFGTLATASLIGLIIALWRRHARKEAEEYGNTTAVSV